MTTALSNNLNELDVLLQDLSAARYSGHVERRETVTESRVYTSHTAFQEEEVGPPRPPERSKSAKAMLSNGLSVGGGGGSGGKFSEREPRNPLLELHAVERSRTEQTIITDNGAESKWEYMGFGIWENREGGGSPSPPPPIARRSVERERGSYQVLDTSGASNATAELDELMTSLNNFKLAERQVDEPVIPPNLDTMLGNLQEDMDKQGVKTTQKGVCGACNKPIVGQVITALGHTWHPEHFTCSHCNQELGTKNFFERDGRPYCEQDYYHLFSPRCGYCQGPILDKCISALDNTWHPEHFLCSDCGASLGEEGFHEKGDSAYCKVCYFDQFAPKCGGCHTPITENYISSLNMQWHPGCFVCKECGSPFHDGAFFEHEGQPYCETHYHALRGSLCAGCHKPISGRCITAMFRKFHPEHFVCSFCLKQLNKGTFKEQSDKPYCHECFDRLFG